MDIVLEHLRRKTTRTTTDGKDVEAEDIHHHTCHIHEDAVLKGDIETLVLGRHFPEEKDEAMLHSVGDPMICYS